ncbi:MAG: preprotein translocase subunit YajC [Oscillospiraceae bacterium]|nr:preprotein translocase subunit YajC [Oscillospiraceae bacterium]
MDPMMLILLAMLPLMYFIMIRPQQKQRKRAEELRNNLQVGDEVTLSCGIVGKVVKVHDEHITIETGEDRVRMKACKWAVAAKGKSAEEPQGTQQR